MTALAERQRAFMASLLDDASASPDGWTRAHEAGLDVYRNNYRSSLVEALRSTFERTERLVGEASFARAAAHHLITHPPSGWTLDLAGEGFAQTCAELFANDREVGELAALEWGMHIAFAARDAEPLTAQRFMEAAAGFGEDEWAGLRLDFLPGLSVIENSFDLKRLWSSLTASEPSAAIDLLPAPASTIVWRESERPVFLGVSRAEGRALAAMLEGASYGEACALIEASGESEAAELAGAMLRRWLTEGMLEAVAQ